MNPGGLSDTHPTPPSTPATKKDRSGRDLAARMTGRNGRQADPNRKGRLSRLRHNPGYLAIMYTAHIGVWTNPLRGSRVIWTAVSQPRIARRRRRSAAPVLATQL